MKTYLHTLLGAAILVSFSACKEKSTGEKIEDKVKDGLDVRPNEKIRDAAEDVKDAVKDVVE
jgi:hypothetical protein